MCFLLTFLSKTLHKKCPYQICLILPVAWTFRTLLTFVQKEYKAYSWLLAKENHPQRMEAKVYTGREIMMTLCKKDSCRCLFKKVGTKSYEVPRC